MTSSKKIITQPSGLRIPPSPNKHPHTTNLSLHPLIPGLGRTRGCIGALGSCVDPPLGRGSTSTGPHVGQAVDSVFRPAQAEQGCLAVVLSYHQHETRWCTFVCGAWVQRLPEGLVTRGQLALVGQGSTTPWSWQAWHSIRHRELS